MLVDPDIEIADVYQFLLWKEVFTNRICKKIHSNLKFNNTGYVLLYLYMWRMFPETTYTLVKDSR